MWLRGGRVGLDVCVYTRMYVARTRGFLGVNYLSFGLRGLLWVFFGGGGSWFRGFGFFVFFGFFLKLLNSLPLLFFFFFKIFFGFRERSVSLSSCA